MASPFPGMDPYLEDPAFWPDFQHRFINCWSEAVADELRDQYEARLDERINLERMREIRIDILHRPDRSLVAVLEVLSPAKKAGEGLQEYRAKRKAVLQQKVHLVELDLFVGGTRLPLSMPLPTGDYFVFLSRADNRPNCEVYSWNVRQPLLTIPIPLKAPDADVSINLGKVFQVTFERGRYARSLSYGQPLPPPFCKEDSQWAMALSARK
jgi:hypothetical protein